MIGITNPTALIAAGVLLISGVAGIVGNICSKGKLVKAKAWGERKIITAEVLGDPDTKKEFSPQLTYAFGELRVA